MNEQEARKSKGDQNIDKQYDSLFFPYSKEAK